jgi:hypothetical protein
MYWNNYKSKHYIHVSAGLFNQLEVQYLSLPVSLLHGAGDQTRDLVPGSSRFCVIGPAEVLLEHIIDCHREQLKVLMFKTIDAGVLLSKC